MTPEVLVISHYPLFLVSTFERILFSKKKILVTLVTTQKYKKTGYQSEEKLLLYYIVFAYIWMFKKISIRSQNDVMSLIPVY